MVLISGFPTHVIRLNADRFPEVSFTQASRMRHYLEIRLARGSRGVIRDVIQLPAVHRVTTPDGALLCTITPGPAYAELEAIQQRAAAPAAPRGEPGS